MPLLFALLLSISNPSLITIPRVEAQTLTTDDLKTIASADAVRYGLNTEHFLAVINKESGWNPTATSTTQDYGIAQWHISAHNMTIEQADDPIFALDKMAQAWSDGHEKWWVAWKTLYGK